MAKGKSYSESIREQLDGSERISFRAMMGEYIIYCNGKVVGGIYDDRLLIKPTAAAKRLMPEAEYELPYEGAKEMLLVDNVESRELLAELIPAVAADLPEPKAKKKK